MNTRQVLLISLLAACAISELAVAQPLDGVARIELNELWRRGDYDDDLIFGNVSQLVEDNNGDLYLLDSQLNEIVVLDSDGEHLRTIGREGEGPGEFRNALDLCIGPAGRLGVVQVFPGKMIQLERDGSPAPLFPLPEIDGGGFQLLYVARGLEDRVVIAGGVSGSTEQENYLRSLDPAGNIIATYTTDTQPMQFGGMKFEEETHRDFVRRWSVAPDGRVAAALEFDKYRIHIWAPDGTLERTIERPDVEPVPRNAEEREILQKLFNGITSWNPNSSYKISKNHMAINQLSFHKDGSLWVLSAAGAWRNEDGVLGSYDVYDVEGNYRQRVEFVGSGDPIRDGVFFSGDRIYLVTDLLGATLVATGQEDSSSEEAEPMQVVALQLAP